MRQYANFPEWVILVEFCKIVKTK